MTFLSYFWAKALNFFACSNVEFYLPCTYVLGSACLPDLKKKSHPARLLGSARLRNFLKIPPALLLGGARLLNRWEKFIPTFQRDWIKADEKFLTLIDGNLELWILRSLDNSNMLGLGTYLGSNFIFERNILNFETF